VQLYAISNLHQCVAQQVLALPLVRCTRSGIILIKSYSPNWINRTCLNQHSCTSIQQEVRHFWRARKLMHVSSNDDLEFMILPNIMIKTCNLATQGFRSTRLRVCENLAAYVFAPKQASFFSHHPMLSSKKVSSPTLKGASYHWLKQDFVIAPSAGFLCPQKKTNFSFVSFDISFKSQSFEYWVISAQACLPGAPRRHILRT